MLNESTKVRLPSESEFTAVIRRLAGPDRIGHRKTEKMKATAAGRVRLRDGGLYDKIICHPKKRVGGSFIATTTMFHVLM